MSSMLASPPFDRHEPPAAAPMKHEHRPPYAPCRAETAECTCPEFCERDHGNE